MWQRGIDTEEEMNAGRDLKNAVREKYADAARRAREGRDASCCGESVGCGPSGAGGLDPMTADLYDEVEKRSLPEGAVRASLGCGNPTALAALSAGEIVLDLGSGGGIDVILSARRVGPAGKAYGLDMTDEMLDLARRNQAEAGVTNVEFLKGEIENIPLPDGSVDVVISNCVINLSADKDAVLAEAFRVLKPGGRFAVSDVVVRGEVPAESRRGIELWVGCVAGALEETDYRDKLARAGFVDITIDATRIYDIHEAGELLSTEGLGTDVLAGEAQGKFMSAFVRATKPGTDR
jgi:SAM-dependent methyltransferase